MMEKTIYLDSNFKETKYDNLICYGVRKREIEIINEKEGSYPVLTFEEIEGLWNYIKERYFEEIYEDIDVGIEKEIHNDTEV